MAATYKKQVEILNQYGGSSYELSTLALTPSVGGGLGTFLDMLITALNVQHAHTVSASAAGGILPSATIGTYGTAFVVSAPGGSSTAIGASSLQTTSVNALYPEEIVFAVTVIGTETLTFQVTATYNDGTTTAINNLTSAAANSSSYLPFGTNAAGTITYRTVATGNLQTLLSQGKYITSLALQVKSSIGSSTATVTGTVYGFTEGANIQFQPLK